jgi:hypothetical protein
MFGKILFTGNLLATRIAKRDARRVNDREGSGGWRRPPEPDARSDGISSPTGPNDTRASRRKQTAAPVRL